LQILSLLFRLDLPAERFEVKKGLEFGLLELAAFEGEDRIQCYESLRFLSYLTERALQLPDCFLAGKQLGSEREAPESQVQSSDSVPVEAFF